MYNVSAILTGDIHIRATNPIARTSDYLEDLKVKLKFISDLQVKHNCPILDAGDLLNDWKISPELTMWAMDNLPKRFNTIIGNHDMAERNFKYWEKGSLNLLKRFGTVDVLFEKVFIDSNENEFTVYGGHYGTDCQFDIPENNTNSRVLVLHEMITNSKEYKPFKTANALNFLQSLEGAFDLVVSGHNHQHFMVEDNGCKLVNVGSLMRITVDQKDYEPQVHLWNAETNEIESIKVPIKKNVIDTTHIENKKEKDERDKRIHELADGLNNTSKVKAIDFPKKVDEYIVKNKPVDSVKTWLNKWIGETVK